MIPKWLFSGVISLAILILTGCEKENDLPVAETPQGSGTLKRILLYSDISSDDPVAVIEEYEYDEEDRISRVSSPMYKDGEVVGTLRYDLYSYNSSGQLSTISNYNSNINAPSGFINLRNTYYTYSENGKKIKELVAYPQMDATEYTLFKYDQNRLVKVEHYGTGGELESYEINEYDDSGYLVKVNAYAYDNQLLRYTCHTYAGGLNIQSDVYSAGRDEHLREVFRTYDDHFNIIALESNELLPYSSMSSYVLRYEYFDE
jgi:hypothetical protein